MKRIFMIDWGLLPSFILSVYTGIELHLAGHGNNHEIWHDWAIFHVIVSLLLLILIVLHIITHRNWYKEIARRGVGKKHKVTLWLSIVFALVVITGFILLGVDGANTTMGLWHYKTGILMGVLSICHILKRFSVLYKTSALHKFL